MHMIDRDRRPDGRGGGIPAGQQRRPSRPPLHRGRHRPRHEARRRYSFSPVSRGGEDTVKNTIIGPPPPLADFRGRSSPTTGRVQTPDNGALETYRRDISKNAGFIVYFSLLPVVEECVHEISAGGGGGLLSPRS